MKFWAILLTFSLFSVMSQAEEVNTEQVAKEKKVLIMMSGHVAKSKGQLLSSLAADQPFYFEIFNSSGKTEEQIASEWAAADLVLLDGINPMLSGFMFNSLKPLLAQFPHIPVVSLGDPDNGEMNQGLSAEQHSKVTRYFQNAGRKNYRNLVLYLSSQLFNLATEKPSEPIIIPDIGLYHPSFPNQVTANKEEFYKQLNIKENQPLIAIAMHRSVIDYEEQHVVDAMITSIEALGGQAFGFFYEGEEQELSYPELLKDEQGHTLIDLMVNYRSLHYVDKRRKEFEQLGVPVIQVLNYTEGTEADYMSDPSGISASLTPFFLVMPEDTGSTDPQIIAATENGRRVVMANQMAAFAERAYKHALLSQLNNADKKIATFIWNYPPGEKNIGAAFLDVPASIIEILQALKLEGYQVNVPDAEFIIDAAGALLRPYYRNEDSQILIEKGLADYLPLSVYLDWFNQLPEQATAPIIEHWGKPEESAVLVEHQGKKNFVIPRIQLGNMIVLPQGVRGESAVEHQHDYHDTTSPVNHSYLAQYLYTRTIFNADALIHLGTHGSLEWLSGKERGLAVTDAPSLAVGNLPVFYPYIMDNVGEAMQAKRRGRATMVSYLTPGFAKAGLYAEVAQLKELIGNYMQLEQGQTKENTQTNIIALAVKLNMLADLEMSEQTFANEFDQHLHDVQDHLEALANQSQPLGVHTFGLLPQQTHLYTTILQILGEDFSQHAAAYETVQGLALNDELKYDANGVLALEAIDGFQLLDAFFTKQPLPKLSDYLADKLDEANTYFESFQQIAEIENLLKLLDGQYIPVSYGGDPIRNPQAVPSGRNLIGFNPAKIPSEEAWQAGVDLMDQTIADYVAKHGQFPEKLAFSLWSLETMRHHGALEAQILHALGIKPVWNAQGQIIGTEIVPYSELQRPRIDVVVSATGLYRDAFPNVMLWLAEAIDKIATLKEENNFAYRHSQALKQQLIEEGTTEENAKYLSTVRIFSNESGAYGTGLGGSTLDTQSWDNDSSLAETYLHRMGFAFGTDESRWGERVGDHQLYNKVLSGTDGVIFSRSTNLYALMTNDDPFQYFGGIELAVRHLDGATPEMYVSNLRRTDNIKTQTLSDFVNQEFRSRYFHPRWIEAMQAEGYAGAGVILDRMNNMWGWEVMTPDAIRDDHWQEFFDVYIDDKYQLDIKEFFETHNADALAQILERMLEAVRKGYWPADEETLKKMIEQYTELAEQHDIFTNNDTFKEFVNASAAGFGLAPLASAAANAATAQTQQVQGQQLKEVNQTTQETKQYWFLLIFAAVFVAGVLQPILQRAPKL